MKNKQLFDKTIGILVNAYINDTLEHSNCAACAIGNLIAANCGIKIEKREGFMAKWEKDAPHWQSIHMVQSGRIVTGGGSPKIGLVQIDKTGYTPMETSKIEYAFEVYEKGWNKEENIFRGLMSVCNCLMEIHEATKEEITEAKQLFVKA